MAKFFKRHWFLTTLAILLVSGLVCGLQGLAPVVEPIIAPLSPRVTTSIVLFLMAFSLDSGHLRAAFRAPAPVAFGFVMNYGFAPLLAWTLLPLQQSSDLQYGLMIAATVPCTLAAASVMTRKGRGNDAVSLLVTLSTNLSCFVLTPLWLQATTAKRVDLNLSSLMFDLLLTVLVPTLLGQGLRQIPRLKVIATRYKTPLGVAAQVLIEFMVFTAALKAGTTLHRMNDVPPVVAAAADVAVAAGGTANVALASAVVRPAVTLPAVLIVWMRCVFIHVTTLLLSLWGARVFGFSRGDATAVAFAGSQKTLPIGLYISTNPATFGTDHPFAMLPMLLYHASQLFFDTAMAGRLAEAEEREDQRIRRSVTF